MRYNSSNNQQELINSIPSKIAFSNVINAIKNLETREKYTYNFLKYTKYLHIERQNFWSFETGCKTSENDIIAYIMKMREENYSYSPMKVMLSSLFLSFDMNDITLNKKEINRYLGEHTKTIKDRAYKRRNQKINWCLRFKIPSYSLLHGL